MNNFKNENKNSKLIPIVAIAILFACLVSSFFFYTNHASLIAKEITHELGDSIFSKDVSDYLRGSSKALEGASIDLDNVDYTKLGDYTLICNTKKKSFDVTVHVVDTTSPEFTVASSKYATNRSYNAASFLEAVSDYSNDVTVSLIYEDKEFSEITIDDIGEYTFTIVAKDPSGNEASEEITCEFVNPPEYILVNNIDIKQGTEFDPLLYAFAWDEVDGSLRDSIQVDTKNLDTNTPGDYEIVYSVTNSNDITEEKSIHVSVGDTTDYHLNPTSSEFETLKEYGYFKYEPLAEENYEEAAKLVEPCLVCFRNQKGAHFSGVIYKITEDKVYISTQLHCWPNASITLIFYDNTKSASIDNPKYIIEPNDCLTITAIPTNSIPVETLYKLKEAYIDESFDYTQCVGDDVFVQAKNWKELYDLLTPSNIVQYNASLLEYNVEGNFLVVSRPIKRGESGTGCFNYKGQLLGTVDGYMGNQGYIVQLDSIPRLKNRLNELSVQN